MEDVRKADFVDYRMNSVLGRTILMYQCNTEEIHSEQF